MTGLVDRFGRVHTDLRISLIDKCNLRCTYCLPAEGVPWLPKDELLTREEIRAVAAVAVECGITEIRLTGGEPLLRRDLTELVGDLATLEGEDGPVELSLTTNGIGLDKVAPALAEAGLARVNVSLDTLDPALFHRMTRRDRHADVLAGIDAALAADLRPVKVNTVLMRDQNDHEAADLLAWAVERGVELRFIEQMPLDAGHTWTREGMVTREEVVAALSERFELTELPGRGAAPAERFLVDGGPATVGVIASVTAPFCGACDRLRLTADGQLRSCLFARSETDLRGPLRDGATSEELAALFREATLGKQPGHGIDDPGFLQPPRPMSAIGG
ncbi:MULTISPECIES: GTP 3',8-cyclase MoaA [Kytococcus]|uniref:GTP 3',8-cyclase n=1 Tax=Kytococcus schroeteri TaxID=138300 RepID=A0A2I1PDD4_9MICO|nr:MULTISPECIES: GTP 3',8-cyclase MoaA [Kytococcus]OFS10190.1 cyclic pyranopterin phosphate synthase [Kytococcus sp. HMSC28H12]PKZ42614.1 GTP 3',8-cyclase MoaA [Kytococcus schroeteri]